MTERRMLLWLFAACWCVLLLSHNGGLSGLDGETFYQAAKSAVDAHRLDVGAGFNSTTGVGGLQYAKSSIGMPLLAAIVYAISAPVAWMAPSHSYIIRTGIVGASMTFIMAALVVAVYWLARQLRSSPGTALIAAIGTVAEHFSFRTARNFSQSRQRAWSRDCDRLRFERSAWKCGAGLTVAMLARAQTVLVLAPLIWVVIRRSGMKGALAAAVPIAAGAALTIAYNVARFGNPLDFGYPSEGSRCHS
jgi:hypothetical protein